MRTARLLSVFVILFMTTNNIYATRMLHRNAQELATLADRVFVGVCISAEEKQMEFPSHSSSLTYMEYTFRVEESIKDVSGDTVVLRQLGRASGVVGLPVYSSGEKYLLFLRQDSPYGLASPIGLGQGAFRVLEEAGKPARTVNAFNNQGLFKGLPAQLSTTKDLSAKEKSLMKATRGPVELKHFVDLIKKIGQ